MTYSDNSVDDIVAGVFGDYIGFACEVGANNGYSTSNVLLFEKKGWTVLCVEANPACAESGRATRKLWRSVAAGAEDLEEHDFAQFGVAFDTPGNCALGTATRFDTPEPDKPRAIIKVQVRRLDRILEEAGFHKLDYLAVDVEGWEPEVMRGFTVERWKPKVIVLEDWKNTLPEIPGYVRTNRQVYDNIYVRNV